MGWFKNSRNAQLLGSDSLDTSSTNDANSVVEEFSPKTYDEVEPIANTLVLQKPIKLNLKETETLDRKRIIDFLCGIAFVLNLDVKCTSNHTYEFTAK